MPRRVQDIIPGQRRSVRDIPVGEVSERGKAPRTKDLRIEKPSKESEKTGQKIEKVDKSEYKVPMHKIEEPIAVRKMPLTPLPAVRKSRRAPWIVGTAALVLLLAGAAFAMSGKFARATFTIVPTSMPVKVSGTYVIPGSPSADAPLAYDTVTVKASASTTVPASAGAYTQTKAQGSVIVYNAYAAQSQRLVAGTRFANDSGLVYRLTSSIVIPGYKKSSSGSIIPGTVSATIVADQAGSSYNISRSDPISDFKIVAYKGTAKYADFYARLASDVEGGFVGTKIVVDPGLLASTTATLQTGLTAKLLAQAAASVPDGYLMYGGGYADSFTPAQIVSMGSSSAQVTESDTLYGVIFKKTDLAAALAGASTTGAFGTAAYTAPGIENLSFSMSNAKTFSPAQKTPLIAKISGSFMLVGTVPVTTLKEALAGLSLSKTGAILQKYATAIDIAQSSAEIAPPWIGEVPTDLSRISIIVENP